MDISITSAVFFNAKINDNAAIPNQDSQIVDLETLPCYPSPRLVMLVVVLAEYALTPTWFTQTLRLFPICIRQHASGVM